MMDEVCALKAYDLDGCWEYYNKISSILRNVAHINTREKRQFATAGEIRETLSDEEVCVDVCL